MHVVSVSSRVRLPLSALCLTAALFVFDAAGVRAQTPAGQTPPVSQAPVLTQPLSTLRPDDQRPVRRLSIDEAVALALEQNINLQVDRIDPQVQELAVSVARTGYTPAFFSNISTRSQTSPSTDIFSGGSGALPVNNDNLASNVGLQSLLPWGATYSASFNTGRVSTDSIFSRFNPQLNSTIAFNYTQPLLRNFTIDATRQQVLVSRKNREIADVQLQQSIAVTSRNVKNAYWDLVFTISNLAVQRQSLQLAAQSYRDNRARVEIGTMAPLDIVQAEAEVAQREEAVILAEAAIERQEDTLRALISNPVDQPDFWNTRLEPIDTPTFQVVPVDINAAVQNALANRTDLSASRKQLEANDVTIRFFRNQSLPDVNALVNYSAFGLAGTRLQLGGVDPLNPQVISSTPRGFGGALSDIFASDFPTWGLQLQVNYPIGGSNAEANLTRARLQYTQSQKQLQANELQVTTQIRTLGRNVQTNGKRVEATSAARALAERRLEAEQKKFTAGMTQNFLVIQAQRDLSSARNSELQAVIDYLKSVVDFETVQQAPLAGGGGGFVTVGGGGTPQQQQQQQQQQ